MGTIMPMPRVQNNWTRQRPDYSVGGPQEWPWIAGIVGAPLLICALIFGAIAYAFEVGPFDDRSGRRAARQEMWRGSEVVRICRDGTYIYRLRDGRHITGGWPKQVSGPDVCEGRVTQ